MKLEIQGLDALATKLGVTAEYLWAVLLKQAPISAALDIAFILLVTGCWCLVYRYRGAIADSLDDSDGLCVLVIIGCAAIVILTIIAAIIAFSFPTALLNPEYWALKQVLGALRK